MKRLSVWKPGKVNCYIVFIFAVLGLYINCLSRTLYYLVINLYFRLEEAHTFEHECNKMTSSLDEKKKRIAQLESRYT